MDATGPLSAKQVRELVGSILRSKDGEVRFSGHALQRMGERNISEGDVRNVLKLGLPSEDGFENGTWRYRMTTRKFRVVIAFRSELVLVVVTAVRTDVAS